MNTSARIRMVKKVSKNTSFTSLMFSTIRLIEKKFWKSQFPRLKIAKRVKMGNKVRAIPFFNRINCLKLDEKD